MSMRTYDDFLRRGLDGGELWNTIKNRCVSHHDILTEMRSRQEQLATYAKLRVQEPATKDGLDRVQNSLISDIQFLETMAWRVFVFGNRSLFSVKPGTEGELYKRMKNDPDYHKIRDSAMMSLGESGCEYERIIMSARSGIIPKLCLKPGCGHKAVRKAQKWLKRTMRSEWESSVLRRYRY